ncbi:MAG: B12-binding domain-containing radical SAM protein, partial [Acidobacteriota bacterium]
MRVLLINPSWGGRVQGRRYNRAWPPLDLLNTAALLREDGFDVSLRDSRATGVLPEDISEEIAGVDRVLLTTSPLDRWQCPNLDLAPLMEWTNAIPAEKLILCGAHGTIFPEAIMQTTGAGLVLRGEPEASAPALLRSLRRGESLLLADVSSLSYVWEGRILHKDDAQPVDLSALPLPAYDLTDPARYGYELLGQRLAVLETSRGCPHRCIYCLKAMYGPSVRMKPTAQVVREIEQVAELGYRHVYFIDLEFCMNRDRVLEICRAMMKHRLEWCCQTRADSVDPKLLGEMASAGCRLIHYGIESGGQNGRDRIQKRLSDRRIEEALRWTRAAGMATAGFFLFGFPWETPSDWSHTEALAKQLNPTYASFHLVTPYPGTELAVATGNERPWWETAPSSKRVGR